MAEYKWQRRERKQKKNRERMPKHGKAQAQIYSDSLEKREKEKNKLLGRIDKMLMKQTPLEDTMGKNLQTIKPQQLAKVTNTTIPQAGQQIKQQQTQNRQVGQNAPQQPPAQRNISFGPNGADLLPNEIKQRLDKFNSQDQLMQINETVNLNAKNPQDYEMAKYLARSGSPKVQTMALNKLSAQDLDTMIQPTSPNTDAVAILAQKTQNPSYMRSMTKHTSPQVRMNLLKNPNITDLTMSEMYDDNDDQIRNRIVGQSTNQELLHLFISDKNPQIRARLVDKLDHDGLKILLTDSDPHVQAMAKKKLQGRFSKMEKSGNFQKPKRPIFIQQETDRLDNNQTTSISPERLPHFSHLGDVGSNSVNGKTYNTPSFSNKSLILKEITHFIKKAEGEIEHRMLKPEDIQAWIEDQIKSAKEEYPDIDINDINSKNLSPLHSRVIKPIIYAKQLLVDYPELNAKDRANITGTFKNGKLEAVHSIRESGPFGSHLNVVLSHIKNANPNNPNASKGMGKAAARRAIEISRNGGKTLTISPDTNAAEWWRKNVKDPTNGMITIKPAEYEGVLSRMDTPKIENEMDEEFTSYAEPLRKDKIMKADKQKTFPIEGEQLPLPDVGHEYDKEATQFPVRLPTKANSYHNAFGRYYQGPDGGKRRLVPLDELIDAPKTHMATNLGMTESGRWYRHRFPDTMQDEAEQHESNREYDREEERRRLQQETDDDEREREYGYDSDRDDDEDITGDEDYSSSANLPETELPNGAIKRGDHVFHKARNIQINDEENEKFLRQASQEWSRYSNYNPSTSGKYGGRGGRGAASVSMLQGVLGSYFRDVRAKEEDPSYEPWNKYMFVTSKRGTKKKLEGATRYQMGDGNIHIEYLASSPRNEKGMPNRLNGTGKRIIYKLAKMLDKQSKVPGGNQLPYIHLTYLPDAVPFYERIGFKHDGYGLTLDTQGIRNLLKNVRKDDKSGSPFFRKDADDWDNGWDDPDDYAEDEVVNKAVGMVGDVSTPTFNGSAGQNYKKKIGSALHFKARGVEGVFDVMKSVKFEDV